METLFRIKESDIVLKGVDVYAESRIVITRQYNGYWRYFAVYNGRVIQTGKGDSQEQVHHSALGYLRSRGYQ
jgi:hypothetical protein